jgi:hypothetical protein
MWTDRGLYLLVAPSEGLGAVSCSQHPDEEGAVPNGGCPVGSALGVGRLASVRWVRDSSWLRSSGNIVDPSAVPKGYSGAVARLVEALRHDDAWEAWWRQSGFDYLALYFEYTSAHSRVALPRRFMRRGDHVQSTFTVVFEPFDKQRWTVQESQQHAASALEAFFRLAARRLNLAESPPLPDKR